jgi:hypothetical protein
MNKEMLVGGMLNWSAVFLQRSVDKSVTISLVAVGTLICCYGLYKGLKEIKK